MLGFLEHGLTVIGMMNDYCMATKTVACYYVFEPYVISCETIKQLHILLTCCSIFYKLI